MAVKIRLKRMGATHAPQYRIIVIDSRKKRDGRAIEEIGFYHPLETPSRISVNHDRVQYWLSVGAQATEQVLAILKLTGDWQKFKGEKDVQNRVKGAEPKPEFVVPDKGTVIREAITQKKAKKTEEAEVSPSEESEKVNQ